ncbi:protein of unknown function [Vibrio tapetis subsp. tapetis]|uniref:Uncharacterized protein n=1 Tax=Vibrio tapetis subsp. tapetis TaxID=1671868 RepID=A0A2N8ZI69_9VIBR|nr:protein of unknown function [Vibrio tapetis subsp. tapetis]
MLFPCFLETPHISRSIVRQALDLRTKHLAQTLKAGMDRR